MSQFDTHKMASGGLALELEPVSGWLQFPKFSRRWVRRLNAHVLSAPIISADECLVEVEIGDCEFCITYDNFQQAIHLEPKEARHNDLVLSLQQQLRQSSGDSPGC